MMSTWQIPSDRFQRADEALDAYTAFSGHAKARLEAHPEWRDWLLHPDVVGPERTLRGRGKWTQDLAELGAPELEASYDLPQMYLAPLRRLKQRELLLIGLLDFAGWASMEQTTEQLSDLADFCLEKDLAVQLGRIKKLWGEPSTGFCILGMGKLGARELNYSSDIDVIFIYGEDGETDKGRSHQEFFTRLGQNIVKDFSTRTGDGSLFRIDLRLRPEGDSGPLALSLAAFENYYAAFGETWERMAMIKAQVCAGDEALSYELDRLRGEFSFSVQLTTDILDEIANLKSRINREIVGQRHMERHVKLGRGGIREIEFLVQTQQLLHARKQPYLQARRTLKTLEGISTCEILPAETTYRLSQAYRWLRTVEHRLQMRQDLQTHLLPEDAAGRGEIAASLGLSAGQFESTLREIQDFVHREFESVFQQDAHTHETSFEFDFSFFTDAKSARKQIDALHPDFRSSVAMVSPRTRASYRRFEPVLEEGLKQCVDPDTALPRFVRFAESYGTPGLFFETMAANPKALELLLTIFERSQHYSEMLTRMPHVFEDAARAGTLDINKSTPDFLREMEALTGDLSDAARLYRAEELTRIFIRDALALAPLQDLHAEYSALARACVQFGLRHVVKGGPIAVIALGKFGGMELTYGSDLDCLLVGEDVEAGRELSRFFTEQRPAGILFPLDCRMRPDGEGPLVMKLDTYREYYGKRAQYWEIQAATRASFIAGDEDTGHAFMAMLESIWQRKVAEADPFVELGSMRARIETERVRKQFPEGEFKTGAGGMVDVEFAVQAVQMSQRHREPSTLKALDWLGSLSEPARETAGQMRSDYLWMRRLEAVVRADDNAAVSALPLDAREQGNLARWLGYSDWATFYDAYLEVRQRVRANYERIMNREIP